MKRLILLVGIPGSGKTTLAQGLVERGFTRVCADDIRLELYGNAAEQGDAKEVMSLFFERLEALLKDGKNIVIDNINTKYDHRQQIISRAKNVQYADIQLWVLDVPLAICLERNKNRARQVPEEVITRSFNTLTKHGSPKPSEGQIIFFKADQYGQWQNQIPE